MCPTSLCFPESHLSMWSLTRVSDVLADLLLEYLLRHDALSKAAKVSRVDPDNHKHIAAFEKFVHSIGIPGFSLLVGADSKVK